MENLLSNWVKKYPTIKLIKNIKSGKEAGCFLVEINSQLMCLKSYKNRALKILNNDSIYLEGKFYRRKSEAKAVKSKNDFGKELIKKSWVRREYYLLKKTYEAGARVPKVFDYNKNSILMEYIGDRDWPAPLIKDVGLDPTERDVAFKKIIETVKIFYKCGIVHGDLSEFNILWWNNEPVIIDLPQAVDIRNNPNAEEVLKRDLNNICSFFKKNYDVEILNKVR